MPSRSTLAIFVGASAVLGFSACKPVYSDTFTYKKNSFKAPPVKQPEVKVPVLPTDLGAPPAGGIPAAPGGIPGAIPGAIPGGGAMPDAGGIPGVPPAPGVPAAPGVPPAVPPVPGL